MLMSLNLNKLEKVVDLGDGGKRARCPACAEGRQDRKGEHLRIYPDGKFGCCVFPGDPEHRKRIFVLAGEHRPSGIKVRVAAAKTGESVQSGLFGRLGRVFRSPEPILKQADASDACCEVEPVSQEARTPRTGDSESDATLIDDSRTGRTGVQNSRVYPEKVLVVDNNMSTLKEFSGDVRSVRDDKPEFPHLLTDRTLAIPFNSPDRFHWWKGGQSIAETRAEVLRVMDAETRKECHGAEVEV